MRNYIKRKLSLKIFFLTTAILLGISALTYGFVAYFMPVIYTETLNQNLDKRAENLSKVLHNYKKEQGIKLIQEFSMNSQSGIMVLDDNGKIVYEQSYPFYEGSYAVEMAGEDTMAIASESATVENDVSLSMEELEEQAMGGYRLSFAGDTKDYTLLVFGSREQVNQTKAALKKVLPWLILSVFLVAFLTSVFYSEYLTRPILYLSRTGRTGNGRVSTFFCRRYKRLYPSCFWLKRAGKSDESGTEEGAALADFVCVSCCFFNICFLFGIFNATDSLFKPHFSKYGEA